MSTDQESKQKFLREHVKSAYYQQFLEYCIVQTGQEEISLDAWSWDFIRNVELFLMQLVANFNLSKQPLSTPVNLSFADYQHTIAPILTLSALKQPSRESPKQEEGSAISLLDSVFLNYSTKNSQNNWSPNPQKKNVEPVEFNFKTLRPTTHKQHSKTNQFEVSRKQFWEFGLDIKRNKTNSTHNIIDFGQSFLPLDISGSPSASQSKSAINTQINTPKTLPKSTENVQPLTDEAAKKSSLFVKKQGNSVILNGESKLPVPRNEVSNGVKIREIKGIEESITKKNADLNSLSSDGKRGEFRTTVKCRAALKRTQLCEDALSIQINHHSIISRNFLMPDYAMFDIEVYPLKKVVKRNYQDFKRLHAILINQYPGIQLPYLQKDSWLSDTSKQFLNNQKIMLSFYLNDLVSNPEIRNSILLENFLILPEHKHIKRKLEEDEMMQIPNSIEELCLLDGKVEIRLGEKTREHHDCFKKYHEKVTAYFFESNKLTEVMKSQLAELLKTLENIEELQVNVKDETRKFNLFAHGYQIQGLEEVFESMQKSFNRQCQQIAAEIELLDQKILPFLRYQKNNFASILNLAYLGQTFQNAFLKRNEYDPVDPDGKYISQHLATFKKGVLEESKNGLVLKYQAGYLSSQLCKQFQRIGTTLGAKMHQNSVFCGLKRTERTLKDSEFWQSMSQH